MHQSGALALAKFFSKISWRSITKVGSAKERKPCTAASSGLSPRSLIFDTCLFGFEKGI
jgi:hypothetical protein